MNSFQNSVKDIQSNLLSYAFILTSDRSNAYSLLNETTEAVLSHIDSMPKNMELKDWAFNLMKKIYKAHYNHANETIIVKHESYSLKVSSQQQEVEGVYSAYEIGESMYKLEDIYREPYTLYVKGHTINEISKKLNITANVASKRINYAISVVM